MLDAERTDPDANITDLGEAIWWAVHDHQVFA